MWICNIDIFVVLFTLESTLWLMLMPPLGLNRLASGNADAVANNARKRAMGNARFTLNVNQ